MPPTAAQLTETTRGNDNNVWSPGEQHAAALDAWGRTHQSSCPAEDNARHMKSVAPPITSCCDRKRAINPQCSASLGGQINGPNRSNAVLSRTHVSAWSPRVRVVATKSGETPLQVSASAAKPDGPPQQSLSLPRSFAVDYVESLMCAPRNYSHMPAHATQKGPAEQLGPQILCLCCRQNCGLATDVCQAALLPLCGMALHGRCLPPWRHASLLK